MDETPSPILLGGYWQLAYSTNIICSSFISPEDQPFVFSPLYSLRSSLQATFAFRLCQNHTSVAVLPTETPPCTCNSSVVFTRANKAKQLLGWPVIMLYRTIITLPRFLAQKTNKIFCNLNFNFNRLVKRMTFYCFFICNDI